MLRTLARALTPPVIADLLRRARRQPADDLAAAWVAGGRVPWTHGYHQYKKQHLAAALADAELLALFGRGLPLPAGYALGLDERAIEYPWVMSRLPAAGARLLDAGSSLNHDFIVAHPRLADCELHLLTLAPEAECFWRRGISYTFGDLRRRIYAEHSFDAVVCLSTLEHVGCDNSAFTGREVDREARSRDYLAALAELRRVLKPGGELLLTLPFGRDVELASFQQFDAARLGELVASFRPAAAPESHFYRYAAEGWQLASAAECGDCAYVAWTARPHAEWPDPLPVEPDRAAAARAVACLRLVKP